MRCFARGKAMNRPPAVEVLLATYNGARFLPEQVDSVLAQDYENIRILARDDGSSDETAELLAQYAARFPSRFRVMPASPGGGSPKDNFLLLMQASTADYVCFCDQDDVWLPDKVSKSKQAMDRLEREWGPEVPLLVFTDLRLVDDKLHEIHPSFWSYMGIRPERIHRLPRLLVQGVVTGCTAMLNRALVERAVRMPEDAYMHDRWISWLAAFLGHSGIVSTPTVLYRQHGGNAVGTGSNAGDSSTQTPRPLWQKISHPRIAPEHVNRWEIDQRQAGAFLRAHGAELRPAQRALVQGFLRCQASRSRMVRVASLIRYGFYHVGVKPNLAMMIHLWKINQDGR
jgi:glycosyltransferase involved in cell wall biosynthesis